MKVKETFRRIMRSSKKRKQIFLLLLCGFLLACSGILFYKEKSISHVSYEEFYRLAESKKVDSIDYSKEAAFFRYQLKGSDKVYKTDNPKTEDFKERMLMFGIEDFKDKPSVSVLSVASLVSSLFLLFMVLKLNRNNSKFIDGEEVEKASSQVTFADVAGLEDIKEDLRTIQLIARNQKKFASCGLRIPRGVLLEGDPGNGKTLLARAFANESGFSFFAINASSIGGIIVGAGSRQIREIFKKAKKNTPAVIFIDELDSIGMKRQGDTGSAASDNVQTLTTLLTCMDGFQSTDEVIVIAATNRVQDLDPALIRPGRFDKHFFVPMPDRKAREQLACIYMKDKQFCSDVTAGYIASQTCGMSAAGIESVLNEAGLISISMPEDVEGFGIITKGFLEEAILKLELKGHLAKQAQENEETRVITAYHEAGHAIATALLTNQKLSKVTILPSASGIGGFTKSLPEENRLMNIKDLKAHIMMLYAGRQAEFLYQKGNVDLVTVGCSSDVERATDYVKAFLHFTDGSSKGNASSIGLLNYEKFGDYGMEALLCSATEVSQEFIDKTTEFLQAHWDLVEELAGLLLEQETVEGSEVKEMIKNRC